MIRLINGNIERVAASEGAAVRLEARGYKRVIEESAVKTGKAVDEQAPDKMNVKDLRKLAKEKGITGASALTRAELLEILKDVE